ncbi:MAG TPA: zinc ribbon domain-containing protein [Actinomycetota bacterium]|nr:zinc ribbon domain-containing protein [Actinomycetota bacterium]
MNAERRCPSCGALVADAAEWCGQCYARLSPVPPAAVRPEGRARPSTGSAPIAAEGGAPRWTCPVCERANPLELDACPACGTPFGRLFEEPARRPDVPPRTAAVWSLLFPGLGHWKAGRGLDALARVVLFGWVFGTLVLLTVSRLGRGGLGPTAGLVLLYGSGSAFLYAESVVDARRVAAGEPPLVSSRALVWGSVALVIASLVIGSVVVLPAVRGR